MNRLLECLKCPKHSNSTTGTRIYPDNLLWSVGNFSAPLLALKHLAAHIMRSRTDMKQYLLYQSRVAGKNEALTPLQQQTHSRDLLTMPALLPKDLDVSKPLEEQLDALKGKHKMLASFLEQERLFSEKNKHVCTSCSAKFESASVCQLCSLDTPRHVRPI
jgi:hypothetical protein